MSERKDGDRLSRKQEILDEVFKTVTAPITYAGELRETIAKSGGFMPEMRWLTTASLPILAPITIGLTVAVVNKNLAPGVLAGLAAWMVLGSLIKQRTRDN